MKKYTVEVRAQRGATEKAYGPHRRNNLCIDSLTTKEQGSHARRVTKPLESSITWTSFRGNHEEE